MRFDEILYNYELIDALEAMHIEECTPIQEAAIPAIEAGRDVMGLAQTGTGKTAAYLLPVIDLLADGGYPADAINCVVMAPTRELALQIDQQMQGFAYFVPQVSAAPIYGGTDGKSFDTQKRALTEGADIVIATPGRLIAHLQMGYVDLSRVSFLVLDEADRMLDMGFYDDIQKIISHMPKSRQTLLFSATINPKIKKLADQLLTDPVEIKIALSRPPDAIDQSVYMVKEAVKTPLLRHLLTTGRGGERTIVFSSSKQNVKRLAREMKSWGVSVGEIHSDLDQARREQTMLDFRSGRITVLVATDIVARGIDVDNIATVINYDVPRDAEDYVHRVGRTARASATGRAVTLVGEREREKFRRIEQLIGKKVNRPAVPAELQLQPGTNSGQRATGRGRRDRPRRDKKSAPAPRDSASKPTSEKKTEKNATAQAASAPPRNKQKRRWHGHPRKKGDA